MINHFGFGYRHLTVWTLLNVLDAVIIVQLERLLRNVLGTKIAERNQSVNNEQMEQKMANATSYLNLRPELFRVSTYQLSQRMSGSSEPRVTKVPSEFLSLVSCAFILIRFWRLVGEDSTC